MNLDRIARWIDGHEADIAYWLGVLDGFAVGILLSVVAYD